MIEIDDKLISDEVVEQPFLCDLSKCGGACCIEGDSGAPLTIEEIDILEEILPAVVPYMTPEGVAAVEQDGVFEVDPDGEYTTTLIDGGPCAFVVEEDGIAWCAVERAFRAGEVGFQKPISCHLYPIRTKCFSNGVTGLNYQRWGVCKGAESNGAKQQSKVYQAARSALKRAYGEEFYAALEAAEKHLCAKE